MTKETRGRKKVKLSEKRVFVRVWTKAKNLAKLKKDIQAVQDKHDALT